MLHTRVSSWLGRRLSPLRLRESERVFIGKSKPRHRRIVLPADQHQGYSICVYRRSRLASLSQGSTALKMDFHRFSYALQLIKWLLTTSKTQYHEARSH